MVSCLTRYNLQWNTMVSCVTTDGAPSLTDKNVGALKKIQDKFVKIILITM